MLRSSHINITLALQINDQIKAHLITFIFIFCLGTSLIKNNINPVLTFY